MQKLIRRFISVLLLLCLSWHAFNPVPAVQSQALSPIWPHEQPMGVTMEALALRAWLSGRGVLAPSFRHSDRPFFQKKSLPLAALLIIGSLGMSIPIHGQDHHKDEACDLSKTVLPIAKTQVRGPMIGIDSGTGFCLDTDCRFVATNYHVAQLTRGSLKIKGERVIQRYLATGPDDEGATVNTGEDFSMKFTRSRDLVVFELVRPLSHKHYHGLALSLEALKTGQDVDIYAYPQGVIGPLRRLTRFPGKFFVETSDDNMLIFTYDPSENKIKPGASGGIVVDRKTQKIVGVLSGIGKPDAKNTVAADNTAAAVPIRSLADFLSKEMPDLYAQLFPDDASNSQTFADLSLLSTSPDFYPEYTPPAPSGDLHTRQKEPDRVVKLRQRAQALAESIRNFIAVQTFSWGVGIKPPFAQAQYEVQVIDGNQRFRQEPDGEKLLENVPLPPGNTVMAPGGEWSELPSMVGTKLNLVINQAKDAMVGSQQVLVFQYSATSEDRLFKWRNISDFILFSLNKDSYVGTYGEVWTDENLNILRISGNTHSLDGGWKNYHAVVTYDWLNIPGEEPKLKPATIAAQVEHGNKIIWCRGRFIKYQIFGVKVKVGKLTQKRTVPGTTEQIRRFVGTH